MLLAASCSPEQGVCYQLLGSNDEADVFPLAIFGFGGRNLDDAFTSVRARFEKPVALKGVVVALLEAERRHDVEAPNIDMEFVGLEGAREARRRRNMGALNFSARLEALLA